MATFASCSTRLAEKFRSLDPAWRWAIGVFVVARIFYSLWGIVVMLLVPTVLQNLDLFGVPIVAYFDVASSERFVFSREINGRVLTFRANGDGTMSDVETQSVWSLRDASAVQGALTGTKLELAPFTTQDIFPYRGLVPERGWFGIWQRFDVLWYQAIAERGYGATNGDIHFPPLYPLFESVLGRILGGRFFFAGWLIAQIALVWGLALLFRLTQRWRDASAAKRAVIFTLLFPTAFFFFTAYSESLFLLLTLLCFRALERAQWTWAGFFAFLAILTRLQGIALLAPLVYYAWQNFRASKKISFAQMLMLALALGAGAFYLWLRVWAGEGNVLPTSEPQLNARLAPPWENLLYAFQVIASGKFLLADVLNLVTALLAFAILVRGWKMLPPALAWYSSVMLLIVMLRYVDTQPLNSMTRYVLTLFPLLMLLAYWSKNRWMERAVVYVCAPLNLYLTAQFLLWGWVA